MPDTTHETPERMHMLPSFAAGLEKQPRYGSTVEYITKFRSDDLVQAAVAAERERCAQVAHDAWMDGVPIAEIPAAIREGGE